MENRNITNLAAKAVQKEVNTQYLNDGRENIERCPLQKLTVHSVREKSDVAAGNLNLLKR